MAKEVFPDKRKLFTGKMNLELKKRIVKCLIWSVATYATETWTLREVDRKKIEAFEMWIWRRMEKISWRDKITNDDVLKRVNEERSQLKEIWQRKHRWIDHVLRYDGFLTFLLGIFERRMLGKRTRGRRQMQMLHDLTVNSDYVTVKQTAAGRTMCVEIQQRDIWNLLYSRRLKEGRKEVIKYTKPLLTVHGWSRPLVMLECQR